MFGNGSEVWMSSWSLLVEIIFWWMTKQIVSWYSFSKLFGNIIKICLSVVLTSKQNIHGKCIFSKNITISPRECLKVEKHMKFSRTKLRRSCDRRHTWKIISCFMSCNERWLISPCAHKTWVTMSTCTFMYSSERLPGFEHMKIWCSIKHEEHCTLDLTGCYCHWLLAVIFQLINELICWHTHTHTHISFCCYVQQHLQNQNVPHSSVLMLSSAQFTVVWKSYSDQMRFRLLVCSTLMVRASSLNLAQQTIIILQDSRFDTHTLITVL